MSFTSALNKFPHLNRLLHLLVLSLFLTASTHAATVTWIGPASGVASWQDGSNWSTHPATPASTDDVVFPSTTTTTVNLGSAQTVNSISLGGTMTLGGDASFQTLTINVQTPSPDGPGVGLFVPFFSGSCTLNCNVAIASNQTWEVDNPFGTLTLTGVLSGPATSTLTLAGFSVLTLGGATPVQNMFTGALTIKGGTLAIQSIGAVTNIDSLTALTINGTNSNVPATLRYLSPGIATLPAVDIALGTNDSANFIDVTQSAAQLLVAANKNLTGGPMTPATAWSKTGPGLFGMKARAGTTASNSTIGDIRILNGSIRAAPLTGPNTFLGTGVLHLGDTSQSLGTENVTLIIGGITGTAFLPQIVVEAGNDGTVTFSNSNTSTPLPISGNITLNKDIILLGGTSSSSLTLDGIVSGTGGITAMNGILNNSVSQQFKLTNDSNSFSGPVKILSNGTGQTTLNVSSITNGGLNSALGSSSNQASNLIIDGALQYNGGPLGGLSDRQFTIPTNKTGTIDVGLGATVSLVGATAAPTGTEKLTKVGAGTLTLTGANLYTGATTTSAGTLTVDGSLSSGMSLVTASTLGGTGSLNGSLNLAIGAIVNPGEPDSPGTLSISGALTFSGATQFNYQLNAIGDGGVSAPVQGNDFIICDSLALNGSATFSITTNGALSAAKKYTLISSNSPITGTLPPAPTMPPGYSGVLSLSADSKSLLLTVSGPVSATQTFTWKGIGADPLWTNSANWTASPPAPRPVPIGDGTEDIIFSTNGAKTILYNNISTVNQSYRSISFTGNATGYDIVPSNVPSYTGSTAANSNQIQNLSNSTPAIAIGWGIAGANIPLGTTVTAIVGTKLTLSQKCVATADNVQLTFSQTITLTGPLSSGVSALLDSQNMTGTNTISLNMMLSQKGSAAAINVTRAAATLKIGNGALLLTSKSGDVSGTSVTNITGSDTSDLAVGMPVFGQGIPPGTLVASVTSANSFVLSNSATTGNAIPLTFSTANSGIVDNGGATTTITGAGSLIINSRLIGAGGLAVSNSGTTTLAATNFYSGVTTIGGGTATTNGTLKISYDANLGAVPTPVQKNITFNGGTLNCVSTGPVTIASNRNIGITTNGGTLAGSGGSFQFAGIISDSGPGTAGALSITSAAPYTPNVQNTYTGGTNLISGATTPLSGGSTRNIRGTLSGAFGSGTIHYQGGLFGNGGGSSVSLDNALSLEGDWTRPVSGAGGFTLNGPITLNALTASARTITDSGNSATNPLILNGLISESNINIGLTLAGTGVIQLNNSSNNYSGATTIGTILNVSPAPGSGMMGYVSVSSLADAGVSSNLGSGSTIVFANNAPALFYSGPSGGTNRSIVINANAQAAIASSDQLYLNGSISGGAPGVISLSAGLNATNATNIQNMGNTGKITLSASNTFSGDVQVTNGTLVAMLSDSLGTDTGRTLILNGTNGISGNATLQLGASTDSVFDLPVFSTCKLLNLGGTITTSSTNGTYSANNLSFHGATPGATLKLNALGVLSLSGNINEDAASPLTLTKSGRGTAVLSGTLGFTGGTTIAGGTLRLNSTSTLSDVGGVVISGGNSINSGSMLRGTNGSTAGALITQNPGGGVVWPGTASRCAELVANEIMNAANIDLTNSGKLALLVNPNGAGAAFGQSLNVAGNFTVDASSILSVGYVSGSSTSAFTVLSAGNTQTTAFNIATASGNYLDSTQPGYPGDFKVQYFNAATLVTSDPQPGATIGGYNSIRLLFNNPSVTPVTINRFTAERRGSGVLVEWNCVSEFQNAGFNLYRKAEFESTWERINPTLIAGRLTCPDEKKYSYYDWSPTGAYEYKLESLSIKGLTDAFSSHVGPVIIDTEFEPVLSESDESLSAAQDRLSQAASAIAYGSTESQADRLRLLAESRPIKMSVPKMSVRNTDDVSHTSRITTPAALNPMAAARWFSSGILQTNAAYIAAKVSYQNSGVIKIPLGMIPAGIDPKHLAIQREGRSVPILAVTSDALLVFGEGYEDDYTNKDALFARMTSTPTSNGIRMHAQGLFESQENVSTVCAAVATSSYHDVYFDYNVSYRPYTFPPWFSIKYLTANADNGTKQSFSLNAPQATTAPAELTINVWSLTQATLTDPAKNDHALQVIVNGQNLGVAQWRGGNKMLQLTFEIPFGVISANENTIELLTPAIFGVDSQIAFLHSMTLAYSKGLDGSQPTIVSNLGTASQLFEVGNVPSENVWVVDARYPDRAALIPYEARPDSRGTFSLRFRAPNGGSGLFYIVPEGMEQQPLSIVKRLVKALDALEYLATGPNLFQSPIQPLLVKHAKDGFRSQFVDQEQLFDYYNYGRYGPAGIQKAVQAVQPHYLLLVGRTTYDYKDYSGAHVDPLCPTFLVSTTFWSQATSDSMFGDLGRGYPEIAVGRLPVNDTAELSAAVQRIINYKGIAQSGVRVNATSDRADPLVADFPAQAASLTQSFPDITWQPNYLGVTHATSQEVNGALTTAANGNADWLVYIGHGNAVSLGSATPAILDISSVQAFKGNAVLLQSTCTAHWMAKDVASYRSIAIQGMVQAQGGICASIGTSTYMDSGCAVPFLACLLTQASSAQRSNEQRWGDVLLSAQQWAFKQQSASNFYLDLSRTEQLFGDPAMRVFSETPRPMQNDSGKSNAPVPGTF